MNLKAHFENSLPATVASAAAGFAVIRFTWLGLCYDRGYGRGFYENEIDATASAAAACVASGLLGFFLAFLLSVTRSSEREITKSSLIRLAKLAITVSIGWEILVTFYCLTNGNTICSPFQFRTVLAYALLVPSMLGVVVVSKIWLDSK